MNSQSGQQALLIELQNLLKGVSELHSILESESALLNAIQTEELVILTGAKQMCLTTLQEMTDQCHQVVATLGVQADAGGLSAFMDSDLPNPELRTVWLRLQKQIEACAEINHNNEMLNQNGQRRITQLMRLLRGESADPLTYEQLVRR